MRTTKRVSDQISLKKPTDYELVSITVIQFLSCAAMPKALTNRSNYEN